MRLRLAAISCLAAVLGVSLSSLVFAEQQVYPTLDACWQATHDSCSQVAGGWSPATAGDPSAVKSTKETVDQENLDRQNMSMPGNRSGTSEHPVVAVDMNEVQFPDVQPYLDPNIGRVRVPVRFVSEQMGAQVAWDQTSQTVTITRQDTEIKLRVNDPHVAVNGRTIEIDAPPILVDPGRVMVPLRFVSEAFGALVDWVGPTSPDPQDTAWGKYQVWIWVDWGYWGKYSISDRLAHYWFYRGPGR